jgi:hypothetical protein
VGARMGIELGFWIPIVIGIVAVSMVYFATRR